MAKNKISKKIKNAWNAVSSKIFKGCGVCFNIGKYFLGRKKNTYCFFLWERVHINMFGNVFGCCFCAPWVFGNIYRTPLDRIWKKSIRLKIARWLSLHGSLHCYDNCFMSKLKNPIDKRSQVPDYPESIMLHFGDMCNIMCKMCCRDAASKVVLDSETLKKNINWGPFKEIILLGGEILFMEQAKDFYLWLTQVKHKKANIYTNGLLINDEWAEHLIKGSDWIYISVNAASEKIYKEVCGNDFSKVVNNIKKLIFLKNKLGLKVKIIYSFTIITNNVYEIADAIRFANDLGCDSISFCQDTGGKQLILENSELKEKLKGEILQLINNKEIKITILREQLLTLGLVDN